MPLTSTGSPLASRQADPAAVVRTCPDDLARAVRAEVRRGLGWQDTADCVAAALRASLPDPAAILSAPLRRGDPAGYQSHLLYAEPDGSFSISAMVWRPGQQTMIHDHVAWCVTGVLQGREYEEIFALADSGRALRLAARNVNRAGLVRGFRTPRQHPPRPHLRRYRGHLHPPLRRRHLPPRQQHPPRVPPPHPRLTPVAALV